MANPGPPLIVFARCKSKALKVSTSSIRVLINHHSPCTLLPARLDYLCTHRDGFVLMHMTLPLASYPVGTTNKHCVYAFIVTSSDPNQSTLPFLYRTIYHHNHAPSIPVVLLNERCIPNPPESRHVVSRLPLLNLGSPSFNPLSFAPDRDVEVDTFHSLGVC